MSAPRLGLVSSLRLVAAYAIREVAQSNKTIFVALLLLLPSVLALIIRREGDAGVEVFTTVVPNIYLVALLPLACVFFGGSLIRDALEDKKLPFLITRPQGRAATLVGLYLGMSSVVITLLVTSILTTYAACRLGMPGGLFGDPGDRAALLKILWNLGLGGLFYGALFTFIGLVTRWPTVVGILWILLVEGALGSMPGPPRALAPSAYFEVLLTPEFTTRASIAEMEGDQQWTEGFAVEPLQAGLTLAVVFAILVGLIVVLARGKDLLPYEKPRSRA